METVALYALITAALYYLGARAVITSWLWEKYPKRFGRFMDCAACAGTWFGIVVAAVFRRTFLGLDGDSLFTPPVVGLCAMVWTPIVAGVMHVFFERLGTSVEDEV